MQGKRHQTNLAKRAARELRKLLLNLNPISARHLSQTQLWDQYSAFEHWTKIEVPKNKEELAILQERIRKRFPVDEYNKARRALDPNKIFSNNKIEKLMKPQKPVERVLHSKPNEQVISQLWKQWSNGFVGHPFSISRQNPLSSSALFSFLLKMEEKSMPPKVAALRRSQRSVPATVRGRGRGRGRGRARTVTPPPPEDHTDARGSIPGFVHEYETPVDRPAMPAGSVTIPMGDYLELLRGVGGHHDHVIPPTRVLAPVDRPESSDAAKVLKDYLRHAPPEFDGTSIDLALAERWVTRVERALESIQCPDRLKVHCGTYSLVDDALYWWRGLYRSMSPTLIVTWEMFREKFFEKYYPEDIRDQLEVQFLTLRQGDRSVIEYEREFDRLSKFATGQFANFRHYMNF